MKGSEEFKGTADRGGEETSRERRPNVERAAGEEVVQRRWEGPPPSPGQTVLLFFLEVWNSLEGLTDLSCFLRDVDLTWFFSAYNTSVPDPDS